MGDIKNNFIPGKNGSQKKSRCSSTASSEDMKLVCGSSGSTVALSSSKTDKSDDGNRSEETRSTGRARRSHHFSSSITKTICHKTSRDESLKKDSDNHFPNGPTAYLNSVINTLVSENVSSPAQDKSDKNHAQSSNGNSNHFRLSQKRKNRNHETGSHHKPAEIFRKDLISAMKIPDTSQLLSEEYWVMRDQWRIEWEKGVQVPVNEGGLPAVKIDSVQKSARGDFRMPRKMIKTMPDVGDRDTVNLNVLADATCRYDLDEVDVSWLNIINQERSVLCYPVLDEFTMEHIMEELESQCHENMQLAIKTKKGLGIEYDENIVCDVCRSPDCEEGNEMVFCDGCNLCVHQACYGILKVPEGSWLCKPCALGIRGSAECILCGKKGGALKSTKSGRQWAHMSCALWIPEISIADPERMEPITKVSHIPTSRWSLICSVCKEKSVGACIQCSVRHCVTAYHVTCAMESRFDMITDCPSPGSPMSNGSNESAIIFRSYCRKHSKNHKKHGSPGKKTEEEKRSDRQKRIAELEEEFITLVQCESVATALNIPSETAMQVMEYWKLKRKANFNRPLVTPKQEEGKALEEAAETGLQRRLRMFTHLRQDLERVRNLCYMIGKREKMKRASVKLMSSVFLAQLRHTEYRMSNSPYFDPKVIASSLPTFGMPNILQRAKEESLALALTKEWGHKYENDIVSPKQQIAVTDDRKDREVAEIVAENIEEPPRPRPHPQISATVSKKSTKELILSPNTDEKARLILDEKTKKNGLLIDKTMTSPKSDHSSKNSCGVVLSPRRNLMNEINNEGHGTLDSRRHKRTKNHHKTRVRDGMIVHSHSELSNNETTSDTVTDITNKQLTKPKHIENTSKMDDRLKGGKEETPLSHVKRRHSTLNSDSDHHTTTVKSTNKEFIERESHRSKTRLKRHKHHESSDGSTAVSSTSHRKSLPYSEDTDANSAKNNTHKGDVKKELSSHKTKHKLSHEIEKSKDVRRSSRNFDFTNSENSDFDNSHNSGMTIRTETISETKRFDNRWNDEGRRKRSWSKGSNKQHATDVIKKPRIEKKEDMKQKSINALTSSERNGSSTDFTDDDLSSKRSSRISSRDKKKTRSIFKQSTTVTNEMKNGSSTDYTDDDLTSRISNRDKRKSNSSSRRSPTSEKSFKNEQLAKNGQGALASSLARVVDKKCKIKTGDIRQPSGQELDEAVRLSNKNRKSLQISDTETNSKKPSPLNVDEPDPTFKEAGLDVSYGSNCPAPLRSKHIPSPAIQSNQSLSLGLRWLPLLRTDDNVEDSCKYPPCTGTPKDQEGYRGDMDESEDSEYRNTSQHHHKHHHRKLTKSRRRSGLNPGKHRTGIGVTSAKLQNSDSSGDDFDLSFSSGQPTSTEKSPRPKLRSISNNTTHSSLEHTHSLPLHEAERSKILNKISSPTEKRISNQITEPKNLKAVGGIRDGLKCEPSDPSQTFFPTTTDGKSLRDNFFEKFSYLNKETRDDASPFSSSNHNNVPLLQTQFAPPEVMSFPAQQLPFQSQSIFPFGHVNINPWHPASALPSIVPSQYTMPMFYQYPPPPPSYHKERNLGGFIAEKDVHHPSPPPMPDSTLSPESFIPRSASVAVQASADQNIQVKTSAARKIEMLDDITPAIQEKPVMPVIANDAEVENEWEVVADEDDITKHRRKHKKKKKKKKRKRLRFPEGYESEKRDVPSPTRIGLPEPTHGAIVPRGHSTQYDIATSSPITSEGSLRTEISDKGSLRIRFGKSQDETVSSLADDEISTAGSIKLKIESDCDTRSVDSASHKLVLKINKRDLNFGKDSGKDNNILSNSQISITDNNSPDVAQTKNKLKPSSSVDGIKLTFKKFNSNNSLDKYRKKLRTPGDHYTSYTVSPGAGTQSPLIGQKNMNPTLMRRLELDTESLPSDTESCIGRKALRERKKHVPDDGVQSQNEVEQILGQNKLNLVSKNREQDSNRISGMASHHLPGERGLSLETIKRGRGRPKKVRPSEKTDANLLTETMQQKVKKESGSQNLHIPKQTDFAKFAGWSKTPKHIKSASRFQARPVSTESPAVAQRTPSQVEFFHRKSVDSINIPARSISTDSDQTSVTVLPNLSPAKHWKKRKVREHETQLSETYLSPTNSEIMSPPWKNSQKISFEEDSPPVDRSRYQNTSPKSQKNKNSQSPMSKEHGTQKSVFLKPLISEPYEKEIINQDKNIPINIMNPDQQPGSQQQNFNYSKHPMSWNKSGYAQTPPVNLTNTNLDLSKSGLPHVPFNEKVLVQSHSNVPDLGDNTGT